MYLFFRGGDRYGFLTGHAGQDSSFGLKAKAFIPIVNIFFYLMHEFVLVIMGCLDLRERSQRTQLVLIIVVLSELQLLNKGRKTTLSQWEK